MLFNSISFAVFLPIVFVLYWFATKGNQKIQNVLLLVASYYFYACWDWRFLFLLVFSTLLDYFTGLKMAEAKTRRVKSFWFWLSIVVNLGFLGVFKYYNFFAGSLAEGLSLLGFEADFRTLQVILPVGISFYTFHGLSYVIDIYKEKIKPEKSFIDYSVFVSFFPLLVAGPIERATHLLPQIQQRRDFNYAKAKDGLRQILWGLFKKIVIADNCAEVANLIFNNHEDYSGSALVIGAILFAFQIYGDFSGYSDIALGTARLFGIDLLKNFAFPYFSRDIAEFWRRWHISLSSWFRDYLYIPLGGSKGGAWSKVRNVFIIFLVSGFWHGANWTFVAWGFVNALFIMPSILFNTNRDNVDIVAQGRIFPTIQEFLAVCTTFCMTVFCWIFFRSEDVSHALSYIGRIFSKSLFTVPNVVLGHKLWFLVPFLIIEWFGRESEYAISKIELKFPVFVRWGFYYTVIVAVLYFAGSKQQFIYFQF
ncbi:MBOAT family O-acyltransferase [Flavobacterium humi]|uniref:MBOAT family protein n=1 Tax=Flavobacterium humi TaxID=2562683 RepID=A0A4Z0L9T9_9FLAO|nr:MBOAT family O-acyltransferase [Flavobacterium humi]TGD58362.1 MBOAT family protein [Flavobacterium humi]